MSQNALLTLRMTSTSSQIPLSIGAGTLPRPLGPGCVSSSSSIEHPVSSILVDRTQSNLIELQKNNFMTQKIGKAGKQTVNSSAPSGSWHAQLTTLTSQLCLQASDSLGAQFDQPLITSDPNRTVPSLSKPIRAKNEFIRSIRGEDGKQTVNFPPRSNGF